ncbi:F protein [avian paramyxovirus 11]|uniref:Fusion glycoprotein F0 n=1 Tax=avian paramyxovirus 11 TaxID=2560310 RepID=I6UB10_9MONO|nr:F protein [Avian paramyxovirus 11]AFN06857.1 F protein [Avian paramyxovirus 11]
MGTCLNNRLSTIPSIKTVQCILIILSYIIPYSATDNPIADRSLLRAGIVPIYSKSLSVYTNSISGYLTVRMLPPLPKNLTECSQEVVSNYNKTITRMFQPISDNLMRIQEGTDSGTKRFVGAVIGSVALGVATSAQITAALAMVQAQDNAKAIWKLKEAISSTNQAVLELKEGVNTLGVAVDKIQGYINNEILPSLSELECRVNANKLASQLNLYLIELTTIFGDQITNPALTPLSLQALYTLAGDTMGSFLQYIGAQDNEIESLYDSGLINGQIVSYDASIQTIIIKVSIPSISSLSRFSIMRLATVSSSVGGFEKTPLVPEYLLISDNHIEEFSIVDCKESSDIFYCPQILSMPISTATVECLKGRIDQCIYTSQLTILSHRIVTYNGVVVANCFAELCRCTNPSYIIRQDRDVAVTVIDKDLCKRVQIGDIELIVQASIANEYKVNFTVSEDQLAPSTPIDISNELNSLNQTLDKVGQLINTSNQILASLNPKLVNNTSIIVLIVMGVVLILWLLALTIYSIYAARNLNSIGRLAKSAYASYVADKNVYKNESTSSSSI